MAEPFHTAAVQTFRFWVTLTRSVGEPGVGEPGRGEPPPDSLGDGGFQECTGLQLDAELREYKEGGRNDGIIRRVGRVKLEPIVLKRGMLGTGQPHLVNSELWVWFQRMVEGRLPIPRYDGVIQVHDPAGTRVAVTWQFVRGLPMKVIGPALNAKTGEIAVEELHIAHEGLRLVG